jgi:hypothetical protein
MQSSRTNILYLSDLHLSSKKIKPQKQVLRAFLQDLEKETQKPTQPDYIIFGGDLVDDPDMDQSYELFQDELLEPLLKITGVKSENLFFCPGNHDISRITGDPLVEQIWRARSNIGSETDAEHSFQQTLIQKFAPQRNEGYLKLIGELKYRPTDKINPISSVFLRAESKLAFVSLNSTLFSLAGKKEDDKGRLSLPDTYIDELLTSIPEGYKAIYFQHHPFDWMNETFGLSAARTIAKKSLLHAFGHVHNAYPMNIVDPDSQSLRLQSGALYTDRDRLNCYSIISLSPDRLNYMIRYRTYFAARKIFAAGEDIADQGVFYPRDIDREFWDSKTVESEKVNFRSWLQHDALNNMRESLNETITDKALEDVFVPPTIMQLSEKPTDPVEKFVGKQRETTKHKTILFEDLHLGTDDLVLFHSGDFGQTSFLKQLAMASLSKAHMIEKPRLPVLIDCKRYSQFYENAIMQALKEQLTDTTKLGRNASSLLMDGDLLLVFENLNLSAEEDLARLAVFSAKYPQNRYVYSFHSNVPIEVAQTVKLPFAKPTKRIVIQEFSRSQVRLMVRKWGILSTHSEDWAVEHICSKLAQMNMVRSPMNVSVLLTIIAGNKTVSPINISTLVENYVEIMLDKYDPRLVFRREFDFKNRIDCLSHIAAEMIRRDNYVIEYSELLKIVEKYFGGIGIRQNAVDIIRYFLKTKMLEDNANQISFRLDILLSYFAANRMLIDDEFKHFVMDGWNIVKFRAEVAVYCDLRRSSADVLTAIANKFNEADEKLQSLFDLPDGENFIDNFRWPEGKDSQDLAKAFAAQIDRDRPSAEERDKRIEPETQATGHQSLNRPDVQDALSQWLFSLAAYSNCMRGLEEIPLQIKMVHTKAILSGWAKALAYLMMFVTTLLKDGEIQYQGVTISTEGFNDKTAAQQFQIFTLIGAHAVLSLAKQELGTEKLEIVLGDPKTYTGNTTRLIGKSIYVSLMMDEFTTHLKHLYRDIRASTFMTTTLLLQLYDLYMRGPLNSVQEHVIRQTVAEIIADIMGITGKPQRAGLIDRTIKGMKKRDNH